MEIAQWSSHDLSMELPGGRMWWGWGVGASKPLPLFKDGLWHEIYSFIVSCVS